MTTHERVKRPEPERTQPIRNWWTLFGPPAGGNPPFSSAGDPVARGVELGYRVIEEYMRQGQSAARTLWGNPYGSAPPMGANPQQQMGAMLGSFWDFASQWMSMMTRMGGVPQSPTPAPAGSGAGGFWIGQEEAHAEAPMHGGSTALTLKIASKRPTEVSVELRPGAARLELRVHDLRPQTTGQPELGLPRLTGALLERASHEERLILQLQVPDALPEGVYSGQVLDKQTSLPQGMISVRVSAA